MNNLSYFLACASFLCSHICISRNCFFKKYFITIVVLSKIRCKSLKITLANYVWQLNQKHSITAALKLYIVKSVPASSNITESCILCLHERREILTYQINMSYCAKKLNLFLYVGMLIRIYYLTIKLMIA